MLRVPCTLELVTRFRAIPHVPRVVYPQVGPSLRSYSACSEGPVPSNWTLTSVISRMPENRAPSSWALPSELARMLRGSRTLKLAPHFGAISHAPRVAYPLVGPLFRSDSECFGGRVPSSWALTSGLFRYLRDWGFARKFVRACGAGRVDRRELSLVFQISRLL